MLCIGDIHGNYQNYLNLIQNHSSSIQVGDFGLGFGIPDIISDDVTEGHKFIRGNHDNPHLCDNYSSNFIEDGAVLHKTMFIGGALSIDAHLRIQNANWWEEEEISLAGWSPIIDKYAAYLPSVMVTHTCAETVVNKMFGYLDSSNKMLGTSRTSQALDALLTIHVPKYWIFGHFHETKIFEYKGCKFVCVGKDTAIELPIDEYYVKE